MRGACHIAIPVTTSAGECEEADGVLERGLKRRVQVRDHEERGGQMDTALGFALLSGGHRWSSRTTSYSEA
jgi:hypothetical protein